MSGNETGAMERRVAVRACPDYDRARVQEAVDGLFALCGGIEHIVRPGMRVLVKVNLLMRRAPERATTTHPEVARAVALAVQRAGGVPVLADSPGGRLRARCSRACTTRAACAPSHRRPAVR